MMRSTIKFAMLASLAIGSAALSQDRGGYGDQRGYGNGRGGGYADRGPGRSAATFFVKDDFGGRNVTVDRPVNSMREFDLNDKVSSITIQGGPWLVCADDDFQGRCEVIDHSMKKLGKIGMDDTISSARPLTRGDRGRH
jgi:hypothetical protein